MQQLRLPLAPTMDMATAGQNLEGASPELRAKLQQRLHRINGGGAEVVAEDHSDRRSLQSFAASPGGQCDVEKLVSLQASSGSSSTREADEVSDADSEEPIEYAMLSVAPHLSNLSKEETIELFDKVRQNSDEHSRLKGQPLHHDSLASDCNVEEPYEWSQAAIIENSIMDTSKIQDVGEDTQEDWYYMEEPEPESCSKDCTRECDYGGEASAGVAAEALASRTSRSMAWLWVLLFALAVAAGLVPQDHHQAWRVAGDRALQRVLPQYQVADADLLAGVAAVTAAVDTDPDDLDARLRRSREFAQARSQSLQHLGRNLVVGAVGALVLTVLLLVVCSRTCLRALRILVPLLLALCIYRATVFVTSSQSVQWIHGVGFLLVRGVFVI